MGKTVTFKGGRGVSRLDFVQASDVRLNKGIPTPGVSDETLEEIKSSFPGIALDVTDDDPSGEQPDSTAGDGEGEGNDNPPGSGEEGE